MFQIDIDHNALFPITNNIYQDFNDKAEKIIKLLDEKVKDTYCRKILENLISNNNDIDMNETIFYCLAHVWVREELLKPYPY